MRTAARFAAAALAAMVTGACGAAPTAPLPGNEAVPQTIMIMERHLVPEELTIAIGQRVTFVNHDHAVYTVAADRDRSRGECQEIGAVGVLGPGELRETAPFPAAGTCVFTVHRGESAPLSGRIGVR